MLTTTTGLREKKQPRELVPRLLWPCFFDDCERLGLFLAPLYELTDLLPALVTDVLVELMAALGSDLFAALATDVLVEFVAALGSDLFAALATDVLVELMAALGGDLFAALASGLLDRHTSTVFLSFLRHVQPPRCGGMREAC